MMMASEEDDDTAAAADDDDDDADGSTKPVAATARTAAAMSALAMERRNKFRKAQGQILKDATTQTERLQRRRTARKLKEGLASARKLVSKLNIGRWIDDLERDQELADQLEDVNVETQQEAERKQLVAKVRQDCMDAILEHLQSFLREHTDNSTATYEEWIADLHPDNVVVDVADDQNKKTPTLDARFYVQDSDHRLLWNKVLAETATATIKPGRQVESKSMKRIG
jgi:hypothetical protein